MMISHYSKKKLSNQSLRQHTMRANIKVIRTSCWLNALNMNSNSIENRHNRKCLMMKKTQLKKRKLDQSNTRKWKLGLLNFKLECKRGINRYCNCQRNCNSSKITTMLFSSRTENSKYKLCKVNSIKHCKSKRDLNKLMLSYYNSYRIKTQMKIQSLALSACQKTQDNCQTQQ